ncbi:MAG: 30S ribosomal protein S4 [Deltaproteobacteria bacterium]|nr:30S ribosomal protein S4 [Deltaproteobacteria bacterium]MBI4374601.1 30S ribosomal protein S4 [Deltaproteobacteria bacterium]
MARYLDSACRVCRREGLKLFLKGQRCYTDKCAIERREYAPGQHGQRRRGKPSEYGTQLREKQKVRRLYGLLERQFRNTFNKASQSKGITGESLLFSLEKRLDNMVYRMGFCVSRAEARQLVSHGHFLVNGKKVTIPSYQAKQGDEVTLREKSRRIPQVLASLESVDRRGIPSWLEMDKEKFSGRIKALPSREELTFPMQEQLIVELYSK